MSLLSKRVCSNTLSLRRAWYFRRRPKRDFLLIALRGGCNLEISALYANAANRHNIASLGTHTNLSEGSSRRGVLRGRGRQVRKTDATARSADVMKFRSWALLPAVFLSLIAASLATVRAQAPQSQPAFQAAGQALPGTRIALIDVNRIFQNHARFKAAMEHMKQDVAAAEKEMKEQARRDHQARRRSARAHERLARLQGHAKRT